MNSQMLPITDNITEVLVMIMDFTRQRHKILIENLNNVNTNDYIPKDLDVDGFACIINRALTEHVRTGRLALVDTDSVHFEDSGNFIANTLNDEISKKLFDSDIEQYLELQKKKLSENSLNSRLAAQLLKRKQANEN